ncbi:MAG: efflux RND transporter permease subunit, partial [Oscillospiraceae bacterium]|nr:efflux RND transporter permease subunit [Oscillospiraceae bacterium]
MTKLCVKKPYTVLVIIVLVLVLGVVSFFDMNTDLLPSMNLPYLVVTTTYPGASPEKVESAVTAPLESALGTVNGVENVTSTSAENYSMVMLEFEAETNMDSAMVKVSTAIDQISGVLPDMAGTPMIMEISPDMMATMYVSVSYEGKDIYDLSAFAEEQVVPYLERQNGVASVSDVGLVEKQVEVRLNQAKIDEVNDRMLVKVSDSLADAKKELDDAYQELVDGQKELEDGKQELVDSRAELEKNKKELEDALAELNKTNVYDGLNQLNQMLEGMEALRNGLAQAKEGQTGLSALVTGAEQMAAGLVYDPAQVPLTGETKTQYDAAVAGIEQLGVDVTGLKSATNLAQAAAELKTVADALEQMAPGAEATDPGSGEKLTAMAQMARATADGFVNMDPPMSSLPEEAKTQYDKLADGIALALKDTPYDAAKLKNAATFSEARTALGEATVLLKGILDPLNTTVADLAAQLQALIAAYDKVLTGMGQKASGYKADTLTASDINTARMRIAAAIGSADAQLSAGKAQLESAQSQLDAGLDQLDSAQSQLDDGQTQIDDGFKQIEDAYDSYEKARAEALESANLDALLNMETLAGMITAQNFEMPAGYIKDGEDQWLLRVGEGFESVEELEGILLCSITDIGDVRLGDVADITIIDNAGESYARVNGEDAVVLSIFKGSTASTSEVSKTCDEAIAELQAKYPGLYILPLMDQGDYIQLIVDSVLSNLMWGALLAIIVLAIFLKDVKPTLVVAFSIPFSLMVAIVLMYFSDVTLNMISLSGLALGVGMLVDNSVVVIENIYRLRARGIPPARAAVQGTKQVAGAIAASTLTTICVFLPLVFTDGLTLDLLLDMALTIGYSLMASLIVALTVVPSMSVTVLKNTTNKKHPWFDAMLRAYDKSVRLCLKHKVLPILLAVGLLVVSAFGATRMGMVLLPEIGGNQLSVTVSLPEEIERDEGYAAADAVMDAILTVPGVETVGAMSSGSMGGMLGGLGAGASEDYSNYMFYLMLDEDGSSRTDEV